MKDEKMKREKTPRFVVVDDDDSPVTLPGGTVLEGEVADEYAERVLRNTGHRNLVPGGKSLSGGAKHSPTVQFRVPESVREQARRRAAEEGITLSRLARTALERYLAS